MAMSKKDFIALADAIREYNRTAFWGTAADGTRGKQNIPVQGDNLKMLADFCQSQNPNFKRDRWLDYIAGKCGPNGGTPKGKRWKENDPHGPHCAMRLHSAAECTCGKLDYLAEHGDAQ